MFALFWLQFMLLFITAPNFSWTQQRSLRDTETRESRTVSDQGAPTGETAKTDTGAAPKAEEVRALGAPSKAGMTEKELKFVRLSLGIDYLDFGGQFYDGFTPSVASNITAYIEMHRNLGTFMLRLRPEAFVSVLESRREVKSSYPFQQQVRYNARLLLAQAFHIPIDKVDTLVPKSVIASTEQKVRDAAGKSVDQRIDYTAAWKTALDGISYSVSVTKKIELSVGKDTPYFESNLLPDVSSLIFGTVPYASLSVANDIVVPQVRVYHDRKSVESPFGVANAYVRAVLRNGDSFFAINPDSFEFSGNFQRGYLKKQGLGGITALAIGSGRRDTDTYGFVRLDLRKGRMQMRNLASWQGTSQGISTQYSTVGECQAIRRISLGVEYYLHTGTPESFYHLEPFVDLILRFRPWFGWLGEYQTHFVVKRGYAQGLLVKEMTGKSEIAKDWNIEIRMMRPHS
jgi:hypothetical protein